jgi:hypothetical protein
VNRNSHEKYHNKIIKSRCRNDDDDDDNDDDDNEPVWPTWAVGACFRGARCIHINRCINMLLVEAY